MSIARIVPSTWHHRTAAEAAELYCSAIPRTTEVSRSHYPTEGLPDFQEPFAGDVLTIELDLDGLGLTLINAGDDFTPNTSISFMVNFDPSREPDARELLDQTWAALVDGGNELIPLGQTKFSDRYGWVTDRFGVGWQLILTDPDGDQRPLVIPTFLFAGPARGRAADAMASWIELFEDSSPGVLASQPLDTSTAKAGEVMFADFRLAGQWFAAMDAPEGSGDAFSPGVSIQAMCETQDDIDRLWATLSTVPDAEQCGWCVDEFGVSWQIVPEGMDRMLLERPESYAAMMQMKRIVIDDL
ncbi:MAG: VOC family protein [Microthrixaceae bacterium]